MICLAACNTKHQIRRTSVYRILSSQPGQDFHLRIETLMDRIVSLREWWSSENRDDHEGNSVEKRLLLDLRSPDLYRKRRLQDTRLLVVPFPMKYFKERSYELPARHVEFSVLVEEKNVEEALSFLLGPKAPTRQRPGKPWKVTNILLDEPKLWEQAADLGLLSESAQESAYPMPRLWQPDSMVKDVLLHHLKNRDSQNGTSQIWDLASGAGRDVAFLAEELSASGTPYQVWGFDHRYDEKETNITRGFWERRGLRYLTTSVKMDLSDWSSVSNNFSLDKVAALFCVRFWKPELVSGIAKSLQLETGTLFGLSHFCKPYTGAPWNFDHPSEKSVLERTQLQELFEAEGWEILYDEIALDSDHGRTMIQFVAKKR